MDTNSTRFRSYLLAGFALAIAAIAVCSDRIEFVSLAKADEVLSSSGELQPPKLAEKLLEVFSSPATPETSLYRRAVEQGDADAQNILGWKYQNGIGVPKDPVKAVEWYRKAAEQGSADAQEELGRRYYNGEGVPKDMVLSYAWLNLAASDSSFDSEHQNTIAKVRNALAVFMSPAQVAEVQQLSSNWKKGESLARAQKQVSSTSRKQADARSKAKGSIIPAVQNISTAFNIIPGVSVGPISIGSLRQKVRSVLGEPSSSYRDGDSFTDLAVHYSNDRASEIIVTSPQYRTTSGLSTTSTPNQFLAVYPEAQNICYKDSGAMLTVTSFVYDAIDKGIALHREIVEGRDREVIISITIHAIGVPIALYGEMTVCQ